MVLRLFLCITSVHNREFVWTETEITKRFNSKFSTVFSYGSKNVQLFLIAYCLHKISVWLYCIFDFYGYN